jgi:hypothetical protein
MLNSFTMSVFSHIIDISSFFIGVLINLLLIALICYYFKRKIENLEVSQTEQAKMLYNIISQQQHMQQQSMVFTSPSAVQSGTSLSFLNNVDLSQLNDTEPGTSNETDEIKHSQHEGNNEQMDEDDGTDNDSDSDSDNDSDNENDSVNDSDDETSETKSIQGENMLNDEQSNDMTLPTSKSEALKQMMFDVSLLSKSENDSENEQNEENENNDTEHEENVNDIKSIEYKEETVETEGMNYEKMTVRELKMMLEQKGMSIMKKNVKKQNLIDLLKQAQDPVHEENQNEEDDTMIEDDDDEEEGNHESVLEQLEGSIVIKEENDDDHTNNELNELHVNDIVEIDEEDESEIVNETENTGDVLISDELTDGIVQVDN